DGPRVHRRGEPAPVRLGRRDRLDRAGGDLRQAQGPDHPHHDPPRAAAFGRPARGRGRADGGAHRRRSEARSRPPIKKTGQGERDGIWRKRGRTVPEGTVANWYKKVGDTVKADEPLFDVETDKVTTEVPSITAGVVKAILVEAGQTVPVGTVLAVIEPAK